MRQCTILVYHFSLAHLAALAQGVPEPADAALFVTAWQELGTRLRNGDYPVEETATWERVLDKLAELARAART
jgi:hypothetical protein